MNALEEAFLRVGIGRPGQRRVVELPRPAPAPIARRASGYKDRLLEDKAAFDAMSDDELELEFISLTENLESIRIELRLHSEGEAEHEPDWRRRAERATAIIRARVSLCAVERTKRQAAAAERRRAENERQQAAFKERGWQRRQVFAERNAARNREWAQRFVDRAHEMLPEETFEAIRAAVNAAEDAA